MQGQPLVSSDGGHSFSANSAESNGGHNQFANSSMVAATSSLRAVIESSAAPLQLTTDGGRSWQPVLAPPDTGEFLWLGFTDASVGYAVAVVGQNLPQTGQLWRTADGGSHWSLVHFAP
jgi:photosystem II stability/assembly factor-like uncharacterized protein